MSRCLVLLATLLVALPAAVGAADETDPVRAAAIRLGREGAEAYKDGRFTEALQKFEEAYRAVPAPPLVLNLSRTELRLGHCDKALSYALTYRAAFSESATATQESPSAWIDSVKQECPQVTITTDPAGAKLMIEGRAALTVKTPWNGRLATGGYAIRAQRAGFAERKMQLEVSAAIPVQVEIPLVPVPLEPPHTAQVAPRGVPVWAPWVPTSVALAGAAVAIAEGVSVNRCATALIVPQNAAETTSCEGSHALLANVGWGIAGAGAIAAVVTWVVRARPAAPVPETRPLQIGFLGNGVAASGRF
jgi:hypothetical protein